MVGGLIINSLKPEEGSPRPRSDAKELLSSLTRLESGLVGATEPMADALKSEGVGPGDSHRPWRKQDLDDEDPICAAFWSNAVAESAGCDRAFWGAEWNRDGGAP